MNLIKIKELYNTVKYLKAKQIYYRLFYLIRNKLYKKSYKLTQNQLIAVTLNCYHFYNPSSQFKDNNFTFLNKTKTFNAQIDWNFSDYGKLWTYNINYFEFLNQPTLTKDEGLKLIESYVNFNTKLIDGLEPYPISLRTINWIKFLSKNNIQNNKINQVLYSHYMRLCDNLEYHLLGNHLIENAFALLFGAYYFKDENFFDKSTKILESQLKEQVLEDGAHFELSPMYHQILLFKVLDAIYLIKNNNWKQGPLLNKLLANAKKMLSFLTTITFNNGNIPMVNDSTFDIAPTTQNILNLATILEIKKGSDIKLKESGYRKINNNKYELFIDVGEIGPKYQPGHAHSDTFNFVLHCYNKPFIVDRGISTYQKNQLRQSERSTVSHNTVMVDNVEQTNVWGGFRVGSRAEIINLWETENRITASHNGYKRLGTTHKRSFDYLENEIVIVDSLEKSNNLIKKAFFHFHPDIKTININNNVISFVGLETSIIFDKNCKITKQEYEYCLGFNTTIEAIKIEVTFDDTLTTKIKI